MHNIYHDLYINASKQFVFDAVSLPEHLINWWPLKCSGKQVEGAVYNFFFTPEYDWYGQVEKCETANAFHIKMTQADADWNPTAFGFDLKEKDNGAMLSFWHKGWPVCNDHFKRSSYCWAILLQGLKTYLENGVIIPFEKRN